MSRLSSLQKRLKNLNKFLDDEPDQEGLYAQDLCDLIIKVEKEIKQLRFANENPIIMVDEDI